MTSLQQRNNTKININTHGGPIFESGATRLRCWHLTSSASGNNGDHISSFTFYWFEATLMNNVGFRPVAVHALIHVSFINDAWRTDVLVGKSASKYRLTGTVGELHLGRWKWNWTLKIRPLRFNKNLYPKRVFPPVKLTPEFWTHEKYCSLNIYSYRKRMCKAKYSESLAK